MKKRIVIKKKKEFCKVKLLKILDSSGLPVLSAREELLIFDLLGVCEIIYLLQKLK